MQRSTRKMVTILLWIIIVFVGTGALLNVAFQVKGASFLPDNQGWFWPFIEGISSWIHIFFLLSVAILLVHYSLGIQSGSLLEIKKTLSMAPHWLRQCLKLLSFLWMIITLDVLTGWMLSMLSRNAYVEFRHGTEFFRFWGDSGFQLVSISLVFLFLIVFLDGYLNRAPWERRPDGSTSAIRKKLKLSSAEVKRLQKAERLIEAGKRYRAACVFEKLGKQYAYRAGKLFSEVGRLDRAKKAFKSSGYFFAGKNRPERAGESFFQAEAWPEAQVQLEKIFLQDEVNQELANFDTLVERYGQVLYQLGFFDEAGKHYMLYDQFNQAASCFEKAGRFDEAGEAYSKAGAHEKSYQVLSESGITDLAGIEKCRWLYAENRFQEAGRCFEKHGFYNDAAQAYEANGMMLAAAMAYFSAKKYEKAAALFIEIGDDDKAVDCYQELGNYEKAAELAAYVGLQDRQGDLFLKAGNYIAAIRSFIIIGKFSNAILAATYLKLDQPEEVKQFKTILEALVKNGQLKVAISCLEASLETRTPDVANMPLFQVMAQVKKKLGYGASAAEIQIKLANLFPDNDALVSDATLASKQTGIPFEPGQDLGETISLTRSTVIAPPPAKVPPPEVADVTATFDADFFLDLTSEGKLERFEMIKEVGQGSMGIVYKAKDRRLDRLVAFKTLHPELNKNPKTVMFFKRESRFVSQLSHPNIVTLLDVGHQKGYFYLVMDFVDGITMRDLKKKHASYIQANFLALWYEASLGLQHAHKSGVLHRNIKPSNIMITKDRSVKVMDFGLERSTPDPYQSSHDHGTAAFLAPELLSSPKASFQSDIYSLGATFYFLATGSIPFQTEDSNQDEVIEPIPIAPDKLVPGMSADLSRTILKCLYRDPAERYRSIKELLTALKLLGNMKTKLFS